MKSLLASLSLLTLSPAAFAATLECSDHATFAYGQITVRREANSGVRTVTLFSSVDRVFLDNLGLGANLEDGAVTLSLTLPEAGCSGESRCEASGVKLLGLQDGAPVQLDTLDKVSLSGNLASGRGRFSLVLKVTASTGKASQLTVPASVCIEAP